MTTLTTLTYETWRISFQSSEQAARAAFNQVKELTTKVDSLQARIDELMLEYCPDEMTISQKEKWKNSQMPACGISDEELKEVGNLLKTLRSLSMLIK